MKQLVFVVESTRKANTDGRYIKATLEKYYKYESSLKISFIFMEGKGNYNKRGICKSIREYKNKFQGQTVFIYVFDKDFDDYSRDDEKLNFEIVKYCEFNGYNVIWFVHNIEHVFLKKDIEKKEKTKCALAFSDKQFLEIDEKDLRCINPKLKGTSNILCVLDTYLERKDKNKQDSKETA